MSDHDIQLLALGFAAGMDLMLLIHVGFGILDDRRDRKTARAALPQLDEARRKTDEPDFVDTYGDPALIGKAGRP
ncbi:hypothetical protein [Streptomyces sp. NBC_01518]|uniref:hypothetical protein n=1 Tax=Streptomyces sp. NBC_01518 TaxID=2903891 RepID=UPI0038694CC8